MLIAASMPTVHPSPLGVFIEHDKHIDITRDLLPSTCNKHEESMSIPKNVCCFYFLKVKISVSDA